MKGAQLLIRRLNDPFLSRACLTALFVTLTYQFQWEWLRFATSECVLRLSASLGLLAERLSPSLISINGQAFDFVIACTFIDVCMGAVPFLWDIKESPLRNTARIGAMEGALLAFNLVRLEVTQIIYTSGIGEWMLVDGVVGGLAYFLVWRFIWSQRGWGPTSAKGAKGSKRVIWVNLGHI